jgi:hypothetical protein
VDCGLRRSSLPRGASLSHKLVSHIVAELLACWFAVVFQFLFPFSYRSTRATRKVTAVVNVATITSPFFFADLASNHNNRLSNRRQRGVRFLFMYGAGVKKNQMWNNSFQTSLRPFRQPSSLSHLTQCLLQCYDPCYLCFWLFVARSTGTPMPVGNCQGNTVVRLHPRIYFPAPAP